MMCTPALCRLFAANVILTISSIQLTMVAGVKSNILRDSLLSEGLPAWIEKRNIYDVWPEVRDIDYSAFDEENRREPHPASLAERAQERLDEIRQHLDQSNPNPPSGDLSEVTRYRRAESSRAVADATAIGGYRSKFSWQPVAFGLVGSLLLLTVLAVSLVVYNEKVRLPRKRRQAENNGARSGTGNGTLDADLVRLDGDRKLAHSAQMYHYQYQKQQMLAVEKATVAGDHNVEEPSNNINSDSDVEEGDFAVYECPGLAMTSELEVKNPLFQGGSSGSSSSSNPPTSASGSTQLSPRVSDNEQGSDSTPTSKTLEHV